MPPSDSELLAAFLAGDRAAVAEVEGWVRQAAAPFRRRLAFEWDDVVQSALAELTADLRAEKFRGDGSLRGYLWRSVNHACVDRLRRHRRWRWEPVEEVELPASAPSAYARVAGRDATRRILELVAAMPAHCRELWAMILDGLSYAEMSGRVGVAEGTLRVRVLRCRKLAVARWAEVTAWPAERRVPQRREEEASDAV